MTLDIHQTPLIVESVPDGEWFCPSCVHHEGLIIPQPSRKRAVPESASATTKRRAAEEEDSEDACMICDGEGRLIVCDQKSCPKVFHEACVHPSAAAVGDSSAWVCPRHRCVLCGAAEDGNSIALTKCVTCVVSCCTQCAASAICGEFRCLNCEQPPPIVSMAHIFQESWSKMACNHLSLAFLRPCLSIPSSPPTDGAEDLLGILEHVRSLEYESVHHFRRDIRNCLEAVRIRSENDGPIIQAFETLMSNAEKVSQ